MNDREKLVELLVNFVEVDAWDNGEFIEKDIDFQKIASDLIAHGVTINSGWISVKDELPEKNTDVWCYSDKWDGYFFVGWINPNTGRWRDITGENIGTVTHWMPFPDAPRK